jgi:hypothetical protein
MTANRFLEDASQPNRQTRHCRSRRFTHIRRIGDLFFAALIIWWSVPATALASDQCNPPNVIPQPVCDMDNPQGSPPRQLPAGWNPFVLAGDVSYIVETSSGGAHTFWGPPSLKMHNSGGTFKAGIFTQVEVSPGTGYRASIAWGAPNAPDQFGRQLGIDPTGGTDPNSPTVVWGPMHWGDGRILNYPPPDVNIDVKARAVNSTMTVFFLVDHPQSTGDNFIFIDVIALYPDESAPAPIVVPPTDTPLPPEPPTATPEPVVAQQAIVAAPPTNTPLPTETPTATPTPSPLPTATPTVTPTPSPTPSPTPTATWTPWPTVTPGSNTDVSDAQTQLLNLVENSPNVLLAVGLLSFSGAGIFGGSLLWLRRRR